MAGFQIDMSPLERSSMNIGRSLMDIGQTVGSAFQRSNQEQQQQESQEDIEAFMRQAMTGDPVALEELMIKSPQAARMVAEHIQSQQSGQQTKDEDFKSQIAQDTAAFVEQMYRAPKEQQEAMFTAAIEDPRFDIDEEDRPYFNDPKGQKDIITRAALAKYKGDEAKIYLDNFFGAGDKAGSLPAETVGFNDLIKDFTPKQQKLAKQVKAGIKGRAVSNAELSAIQSGEIDSYSKWKVEQKQAEKFAELSGSSRAKRIDKGFETITKIDGAVRNIDRAIAALDKGAGVGVFEKMWPSIAAASVELDNIRGSMALDVVGATTFGALSKGELDLAKDVALPTGLDTDQLKEYLVKKKVAQQKLRDYYNEQIQFLDQGGTVAGFLRSKEKGQAQQGGNNQDQQALEWAKANPNDPRAEQILNKLKG